VGIPAELADWGVGGARFPDMVHVNPDTDWRTGKPVDWRQIFSAGLIAAVDQAVRVAGGHEAGSKSLAQRARAWFVNAYPLLGALATGFKIIEDNVICARMHILVAAVDAERRELFINPACGLADDEMRFVMAHELLHVGLRHQARQQGRDAYLWNVACDYVINGWLIEMGLGVIPKFGGLYDAALKGLSAEGVYDRIVTDLRRYRKLATLRGMGLCDMLDADNPRWWESAAGVDLDSFYRRCMAQGLRYHQDSGRGTLPLGLTQEIEALAQPAVGWDVELARWFDHHFSPMEKRRSFARASRRQSSTPEIPRPRWVASADTEEGRTFGVVLDTSGSMSRAVLGMALGAIASYSMSRDVPWVRVVFCDAVAYDAGYLRPEGIAEGVRVKGRGGTILQAGVDLLESATDFPEAGPILIITDGRCDRLRVRREHAYVMPEGATLPFVPVGPVFRIG
jgi:predicted metal-dependent peptidase